MPIDYEIDSKAGLIRSRGVGRVGDQDLLDYVRGIHEAPGYGPALDELMDLRGVELLEVTGDGIRNAAAEMRHYDPILVGARVAVVAPKDVLFGLSRMYQMQRGDSPDDIQVFRTLEEAEHWLAEPPAVPETASQSASDACDPGATH